MPSSVVANTETLKITQKKQQQWSTKYIAIGVTACIGGLIYQLITGSLYQWGIINIYVTSHLKTIDPSITLESNGAAFPIMMYCMGLPMRFGIYLAQITHPMIVLITCQVLLSLSIFVSSYMTSMWTFVFFYGILFGLLVGSAFMIPIIEVNKYFPGKKNYVNGSILVGTGSGSVVFGMFSYSYLNPNHLKPLLGYYIGTPQLLQIADRVPTLLKILALMYFLFGMLGIAMMSPVIMGNRRKQNAKRQQQKARLQQQRLQREQNERNGIVVAQQASAPTTAATASNDHKANSMKQAFYSWICWVVVAIVLFTSCGLYLLNGNYKTYVKKSINDDYFLTIVGAVGAILNGCSRFFWNIYFLKTGYKTVLLTILTISIAVYSTIRFTINIPGAYMIQILLINTCIGGLLVSTPTVIQIIFGQRTGQNIYGFYWEVVATGNLIQYLFVYYVSPKIGFDNVIYIFLGLACLAVPMVVMTKFQGPWKNQTVALEYCVGWGKKEEEKEKEKEKAGEHSESTHEVIKPPKIQSAHKQPSKKQTLEPLSHQYILKYHDKHNEQDKTAQSGNTKLILEDKGSQQPTKQVEVIAKASP